MTEHRWHWVSIGLLVAGIVAVVAAAAVNFSQLGWWEAVIIAGCVAAASAAFFFRRKLSAVEIQLESLRRRLADEEIRLDSERSQFEELRLSMQEELKQEASRLGKREQALADRLVTYHEWMEFPQPLNLANPPPSDEALIELARKDRQMLDLLKSETKILYDNILQNKYAPDGTLSLTIIRDDVVNLVTRVAHVYQPDVDQPLLEASLARVLRAVSRAGLQMLVVLDELPVDVKHASLNSLYGYIRRAVSTWRMYKSAEPYWPYVNTAYYLSRFALGANPLALGAWWFVGNLGSRGAQALARHVIDRQALALLSSLVRVIGYEVAGIYGGSFRHRDANWIYAAELTELVSEFPLSRDSLAHALRELGSLELRSEYDRVFLYRCLANRKSAEPGRYSAAVVLAMDERRAVATRLERFLEAFVHGKSSDRIGTWKIAAEQRLGIKLSIALKSSSASVHDQVVDAVRSLASFLVAIKQLDPADAAQRLAHSSVLRQLPIEERSPLQKELAEHASFFFEHADLDPDGDLADIYLEDLASLNARTPPRAAGVEDALDDVAAYLRRPPRKMQALVEKHYASALFERLPADASQRRVPAAAARAALDLLVDAPGRFLYGPARLEWPEQSRPDPINEQSLWLLGVDRRLLLFAAGDQPRVVWIGAASDVYVQPVRQLLATGCRLSGGQWQVPLASRPLAIRLSAGLVASYAAYFEPLLVMIGARAPQDDTPSVPAT